MHEVASGVDGSTRDYLRCTKWVKCEEVVVIETAVVCVSGGGIVFPWLGVSEDAIECGSGCERNGDMQGKVYLSLCIVSCGVVG